MQEVFWDLCCQLLVAVTACRRVSEWWFRGVCSAEEDTAERAEVMASSYIIKLIILPYDAAEL